MVLDTQDILLRTSFNVFGSIGVLERIVRIFKVLDAGPYIGNHDCLAVAAKTIFEQPRQLGVPIRHIVGLPTRVVFMQSINAVTQGQQRLIDICAFYHPHASVVRPRGSLAPRQVDQTQLADVELALETRVLVRELASDLHDGVRAGRSSVGPRGFNGSLHVALQQQAQDFLC